MKTYDGERVTTLTLNKRDDEFIEVQLEKGLTARCRLWYLRELLAADKNVTKLTAGVR